MSDLAAFLEARIAEDEALANDDRYIWATDWKLGDPARVLAECAAKRRIMEECGHTIDRLTYSGDLARAVLGHMAAIYADHPDYREEWR